MRKKILRIAALIAVLSTFSITEAKSKTAIEQSNRDMVNNSLNNTLPINEFKLTDLNHTQISYSKSSQDNISRETQQILGFFSGGLLGIIVAPFAYGFFGGNIILWAGAGVILGGVLWSIQGAIIAGFITLISKIFSPEEESN